MKTYRHLYPPISDFDNLHQAFRKARRGKRSRPDVADFEIRLEVALPRLHRELVTQS